jgi:2-methylcitrate dehydratase
MTKDKTLSSLTNFVINQRNISLTDADFLDSKRRLTDTLGCGLAAFNQKDCEVIRTLAMQDRAEGKCSLLGTYQRTSVTQAAFANSFMIRYLDGADTYPGGGGHPSDCWAGLLALAQQRELNIDDLFRAARVAYNVFHNLFVSAQLRERGIDNAFYVTLGTTVGCAYLMDLDYERTANAISLAIVPNIPLAVARTGALSTWKAGASANANRNGVFAAKLAEAGIQGPAMPFEGSRGLFDLTGSFKLEPFESESKIFPRMQQAHMKQFLCDYHSQTPILAAMQLHKEIKGESIESVNIYTYKFAHDEVGSDPEKWSPQNRETADHSMPWIVAGILLYGNFGEYLFNSNQLKNSEHLNLARKITVEEDSEFTMRFPNQIPCKICVTTISGRFLQVQVDVPLGHPSRPITNERLREKFFTISEPVLGERTQIIFNSIWQVHPKQPVSSLLDGISFHH